MKLSFPAEQLNWVNSVLRVLVPTALKLKVEDKGFNLRTIKKMQYKFTPNAQYVYLTARERQYLTELAEYRLSKLNTLSGLTAESEVVKGVIRTLTTKEESQ